MNPLDFPCPHCRVGPGEKCKNYLGKGKAPCRDRGPAKVQMKHAAHKRTADAKNAKARAALGPLFEHEAEQTTPEAEWWRWRVAKVGEDFFLKQHTDEFLSLLPVERWVRMIVGPEAFAKLDDKRRRTYPKYGYAYGFWKSVLCGERIEFAYEHMQDRKPGEPGEPGEPAVRCVDWYENPRPMTDAEYYAMFPFEEPPPLPAHPAEAETVAWLDARFAAMRKET